MLIPFGILSSAGSLAEGDFELIETFIVAGSSTSSITFSNLGNYSSTYKHLQARIAVRTDRTSLDSDFLRMRLNSDTGNNYSRHNLFGDGSAVISGAAASVDFIAVNRFGSGATANYFGAGVVDILDSFSTTKNTTTRSLGGCAGLGGQIYLESGAYLSTAAISSLTFAVGGGTALVAGSRFSLYGIKG